jgi:hypothetical protein
MRSCRHALLESLVAAVDVALSIITAVNVEADVTAGPPSDIRNSAG